MKMPQSKQSGQQSKVGGQGSTSRIVVDEIVKLAHRNLVPAPEAWSTTSPPKKLGNYDPQAAIGYEEHDRQRKVGQLWKESGVPKRHGEKVGTFQSPEAWHGKVCALFDMIGKGFLVVLLGNRGPGKTQAAVEAIREACDKGMTCRYITAHGLFMDVREAFSEGTTVTEQSVVEKYVRYDFLAIDELGVRAETDFEQRTLVHVLDGRYNGNKDTILIANQTPDAFRESIGDSVFDRLRETGGVMEFTWPSFRGK